LLEINNLILSIVFDSVLIIAFSGMSLVVIGSSKLQLFISTFRKKGA
jgi:hypothetical protein